MHLSPIPPPSFAAASPPMVSAWEPLPYTDLPCFDANSLLLHWPRLQAGQALAPPTPGPLLEGWVLYHNGEFAHATARGLQLGDEGLALANRATAIYANYLEPSESQRLALFQQVSERTAAQVSQDPDNCQALYWHAYALGRYSQGVSVARTLALGLGNKIKTALERVIALQPRHADAHFALGAFHAGVIDKVGPLVGRMTYGVDAHMALEFFERGLLLHPNSPTGLLEYARALLILQGEARETQARALVERVARLSPADARERLDVELARAELAA